MSEWRALGFAAAFCGVLVLILSAAPRGHATSGTVYEPVPPFCEGGVLHDYLKPLKRMPKLRSGPATGRLEPLGFGPGRLRVRTLPSLIVGVPKNRYGRREAGYQLLALRGSAKLDWEVTTTLSRVDWRGRVVKIEKRVRRQVASVYRGHGAGVRFELDPEPAVYRLTALFHSESGRKLGGLGFYVRVVAPIRKARLALDADSYSPGETVFGRIENFGAATALYGARYAIERLEGSTWVRVPESPSIFILPLYVAGPGRAGSPCSPWWVPATVPPGRYRMLKEVDFDGARLNQGRDGTVLTAEFDILPSA